MSGAHAPTRTNANKGRSARSYIIVFPDGTATTRRSFGDHGAEAEAGCYRRAGRWYVVGIYPVGGVPTRYTAAPATMV